MAIMLTVYVISSCAPAEEPTDTTAPLMGELLSYEEIPERCCAMRLRLRYTNHLDHRAVIECRFEVTPKDGQTYLRWVSTPEPLRPGASVKFSTVSEFGAYDNVSDVHITSCKEAPDA